MRSGRTDSIAIVLGEMVNPYNAYLMNHLTTHLHDRGYTTLMFVTNQRRSHEERAVQTAISKNVDAIISAMLTLITQKLPGYVNAKPFDIQIMTPMRKGALGVERLNTILQSFLNPPDKEKPEKEIGGITFRLGDKVMQIKNNYQMEWEVRNKYGIPMDKGSGIFNGDTGIIQEINLFTEELTVEFDEGKMVEYSFKQLEELELAYAITIHKSQGSEYPAVIIPVHSGPRMLMTRNLLYTAVTRARTCVCLVGLPDTFHAMAANQIEQKRYSGLQDRIVELAAL